MVEARIPYEDLAAVFPDSNHSLNTTTGTILIYPPPEKQTQTYCEVICDYAETFGLHAETITDASVPYVHAQPVQVIEDTETPTLSV